MFRRSIESAEIAAYAIDHSSPPDPVLRSLTETTGKLTGSASSMQIGADQGAFMAMLSRLLQPRFAVEVGTFTGYSSICIARGLAPGGRLLCCDVSREWTVIARKHWEMAGLADRIELRLAPAVDTLAALPKNPTIDFAFIDADKGGYVDYYELILERLSPAGLILFDNTLWSGRVAKPAHRTDDPDTTALRLFNDALVMDDRVTVVQLTIGDGVTMVTRRG